jgi:dTDP-4-dehydrorhamnose reductase
MMRLYRERGALTVVDDHHGQATWTRDLAEQTVRMLDAGVRSATMHDTSSGETTWHGFAQAIVENLGGDPGEVAPCRAMRSPGLHSAPLSTKPCRKPG